MRFAALGLALLLVLSLLACHSGSDNARSSASPSASGISPRSSSSPAAASRPSSDPGASPTLAASPSAAAPPDTTSPSAQYLEAAKQAAAAAVLVLADLPSGWTVSASGDATAGNNFNLSGDCAVFNENADFPGSLAKTKSDDFAGPDAQEVSSTLFAFASSDNAQAGFDNVNSLLDKCNGQIEDSLRTQVQDSFSGIDPSLGVQDLQLSVKRLDFASIGDETGAFRVSVSGSAGGETFTFTADGILIRQGALDATFGYFTSAGDVKADEEQQLASRLAGKMAAANAALPQ